MVAFSKQPTSWKIIMEPMTGNALTYVILSKAEEHVPYRELVGTKEGVMLQPGCRTKHGRYNQVQLHSSVGTRQHH